MKKKSKPLTARERVNARKYPQLLDETAATDTGFNLSEFGYGTVRFQTGDGGLLLMEDTKQIRRVAKWLMAASDSFDRRKKVPRG